MSVLDFSAVLPRKSWSVERVGLGDGLECHPKTIYIYDHVTSMSCFRLTDSAAERGNNINGVGSSSD